MHFKGEMHHKNAKYFNVKALFRGLGQWSRDLIELAIQLKFVLKYRVLIVFVLEVIEPPEAGVQRLKQVN